MLTGSVLVLGLAAGPSVGVSGTTVEAEAGKSLSGPAAGPLLGLAAAMLVVGLAEGPLIGLAAGLGVGPETGLLIGLAAAALVVGPAAGAGVGVTAALLTGLAAKSDKALAADGVGAAADWELTRLAWGAAAGPGAGAAEGTKLLGSAGYTCAGWTTRLVSAGNTGSIVYDSKMIGCRA